MENNIILKQILAYITVRDSHNIDFKEFAILKFKCINNKKIILPCYVNISDILQLQI